jgi:hypothetical protein
LHIDAGSFLEYLNNLSLPDFLLPLWAMQPKIRRVGDRSIVPVKHGSLAPGAGEQVKGGGALSPVPGTPEQL